MNSQRVCPNCFSHGFDRSCRVCGYRLEEDAADTINLPQYSVIGGRYLLGRTIGIGGFGITYAALDTSCGSKVAVKEYFPNSICLRERATNAVSITGENQAAYRHGLHRFLEEARVLQSLVNCPGVVRVENFIEQNNTAYIVMEFVDGRNLKEQAKKCGGRLPFETVCAALVSVAQSMEYVHEKGLLHRDISPDNIIITSQGRAKIVDFGAAREFMGNRSLTVVVKKGYAPPEQYSTNGRQGRWTDIYALACTIYAVLCGTKAPEAASRLEGVPVPPLSTLCPDVPESFSRAIQKAMELSPEKRFQTMREFAEAVMTDTGKAASEQPHASSQAAPKPPGTPYLKVLEGPLAGLTLYFKAEKTCIVGRQQFPDGLLLPASSEISRAHMLLCYEPQNRRFVVTDNNSTNGIYCSSRERLAANCKYAFYPGDRLLIASQNYPIEVNVT